MFSSPDRLYGQRASLEHKEIMFNPDFGVSAFCQQKEKRGPPTSRAVVTKLESCKRQRPMKLKDFSGIRA
jgi:hypothetical protein